MHKVIDELQIRPHIVPAETNIRGRMENLYTSKLVRNRKTLQNTGPGISISSTVGTSSSSNPQSVVPKELLLAPESSREDVMASPMSIAQSPELAPGEAEADDWTTGDAINNATVEDSSSSICQAEKDQARIARIVAREERQRRRMEKRKQMTSASSRRSSNANQAPCTPDQRLPADEAVAAEPEEDFFADMAPNIEAAVVSSVAKASGLALGNPAASSPAASAGRVSEAGDLGQGQGEGVPRAAPSARLEMKEALDSLEGSTGWGDDDWGLDDADDADAADDEIAS